MRRQRILSGMLVLTVIGAAAAQGREWVDNTGTFRAEAQYVGSDAGRIVLRLETGEEVRVAPRRLSEADREFIKRADEERVAGAAEDQASAGRWPRLFSFAAAKSQLQPVPTAEAPHFKHIYCGDRGTFHLVGDIGTAAYWSPYVGFQHYLASLQKATGPNPAYLYYDQANGHPAINAWAFAKHPYCCRHSVWFQDRNSAGGASGWHRFTGAWHELPR